MLHEPINDNRHRKLRKGTASFFFPACPPVEEVSAKLAQLGYRLVFELAAQRAQDSLPELPAQYHYRHASGAEVIFLAGQESPLHTGVLSLPFHESRFWLSRGGNNLDAFQLTASVLAACWRLQWHEVREVRETSDDADDAEEVA